ncbi:hypothetical protein, partial [Phocaeicola vulgatus]|uniref:hypothetical protein n=1 Tax=Phocaeicola vulgatus TaxID=821 RepID=UPI001F280566
MNEFFERFKINKQVVQAGAPYVIYIWCTEKTRTVNIDIDRFGFKINKQVVQAGAPYVIYIWCTEKTRTVNIDIDRFGIL